MENNINYIGQTGWICPKCGRVYSPYTPMCGYCAPKTINSSTSTSINNVPPNNTTASYGTFDKDGMLNYPPGVRSK